MEAGRGPLAGILTECYAALVEQVELVFSPLVDQTHQAVEHDPRVLPGVRGSGLEQEESYTHADRPGEKSRRQSESDSDNPEREQRQELRERAYYDGKHQ